MANINIQRLSSFSDGDDGGNPAGVLLLNTFPTDSEMQSIAAKIGYSETAFAMRNQDNWRVRYFSPESEVPFCGHATIALGAALAREHGEGVYSLELNETNITVEGLVKDGLYSAALQSPDTRSSYAKSELIVEALNLFGYSEHDLDQRIPPARANGGAEHLIIALNSRSALKALKYDLDSGRKFMRKENLVTVMFVYCESETLFHSRNPFASGGVYEDPATGAASAAFAGYLRDIGWSHGGEINITQGEDMGSRSLINAIIPDTPGSSIRISGTVRFLDS